MLELRPDPDSGADAPELVGSELAAQAEFGFNLTERAEHASDVDPGAVARLSEPWAGEVSMTGLHIALLEMVDTFDVRMTWEFDPDPVDSD